MVRLEAAHGGVELHAPTRRSGSRARRSSCRRRAPGRGRRARSGSPRSARRCARPGESTSPPSDEPGLGCSRPSSARTSSSGQLDREDGLAGRLEEDEPDAAARAPSCRGPSPAQAASGVDRAGSAGKTRLDLLEDGRVETEVADREAQRSAQSERHSLAVGRALVAARRLEPVRERVTEVQDRPPPRSVGSASTTEALNAAQARTIPSSSSRQISAAGEQPRLHDLGHALGALRGRKRLQQVGSITTRAGGWNAPTRFLPSRGRSPSFRRSPHRPGRRASTGTGTQRHAAEIRRGDEPRHIGRRAAARARRLCPNGRAAARPRAARRRQRLRALARRGRYASRRVRRSPRLAAGGARARRSSATSAQRPARRERAPEAGERSALDDDAARGQQDAVDSRRDGVGRLGVGRACALAVQLAEPLLVRASGRSLRRTRRHDSSTPTSSQTVNACSRSASRVSARPSAPPPSASTAGSRTASSSRVASLSSSRNRRLAVPSEERGDAETVARLELGVDVDERTLEQRARPPRRRSTCRRP